MSEVSQDKIMATEENQNQKTKNKRQIRPTIKQQGAVVNIVENRGKVGKSMRDAGYATATAKNPKNLTDSKGFKVAAKPFLLELQKEKELALKQMKKKRSKAKYRDLTDAVEKFTKLEELLGGNPTERIGGLADLLKQALRSKGS